MMSHSISGQIDVVTKSGTNQFHGSVFGYIRNSVFDAREFIDPVPIPAFRLGQFGGTFGGPIKKDKAFFFLSCEGTRAAIYRIGERPRTATS